MTNPHQTQVGIILTQKQTILCPGCHHAVRLMVFLRHQIINQNTNICLRPVQNKTLSPQNLHRRVYTGHKALYRRFFIAGTAVKLAAAEQAADGLKFQRGFQLTGINAVILNCICIPNDFYMLQSRNGPVHRVLHILRKRTRHTAQVHFIGIQSFRLHEDLVTVLIRELYHLVFNRRTISGARSLNRTGKQRRPIEIGPYNLMGFLAGVRQPTGNLLLLDGFRVRRERKRYYFFIPKLLFHPGKINAAFVHSGRCSRLKPIHFNTVFLQ